MYVYMFLCFFALAIDNTIASCSFNLDSNLDGKSPLVIKNNDVLLPDNELGDVELSNYDQVQLLCSGSKNNLIQYHGYLVTATCRNGKFTLPNGNSYNFKVLKCQNTPMPHAQEIGRCNAGAKLISLGFTLGETNFLEKITLCFDAQRLTTYWSRNKLRPSSYSCQIHDRGSFKIDFFNAIHSTINPDEVYLHSTFDRGHLTPRCDFFTGPEKRMTFYYINVSPQNRKLNQGNWKTLEGVIRTASKGAKRTLVIYTGTTDTRKYLKKQIPIQRYFWKVVIDANSGEGIAFIGVNSVEDVPSPCLAVDCQQIMWLGSSRFRFSNISKGAIHCCAIDNLRNIPNIELPTLSEYRGGLLRNM